MSTMVQKAAGVKGGRLPFRPLNAPPMIEYRHEAGDLIVTLIDRRQTEYLIQPLSSDVGGCAFRWRKLQGDRAEYDVLANGSDSSCSCAGHTYTDGCKHIHALFQLLGDGVLNVAPGSAAGDQNECAEYDF
jgi:hypothetical protein